MKKIIIVLGFGIAYIGMAAQTKDATSYSFSVKQAIDYALQNKTDVKNAIIDEELARKKVAEIRGTGFPQINSSLDVKDYLDVPTVVAPARGFSPNAPPDALAAFKFGVQYQSTASLDASQMLFNSDYFLGLKGSKVFIELSTRSLTRTKIEAAATVSKAYYTVLVSQERAKLLDANISRLKKVMDDTKALMDNGFAEKLDYDRLTVTYNNLIVEKEKVDRLLEVGTYLLKYQMGMDINSTLTVTDKLDDVKFDATSNLSATKFDYSKRIEYGIFETQADLAKLDLKRQKFAYLPYAFAYGSLGSSAYSMKFDLFNGSTTWYGATLIGATIKMPIFTGLQRNSKIQQSKLKLQQAQNNLDNIKKSIDLDLASSATTLTNASASFANQKKNITIAEDVARVTKIKFEQGVGSNLELVSAETALKEAQTNYFNALYDAIIAKIDFDKANGNLK